MKLLTVIGIVASAGAALALGSDLIRHGEKDDHASCCAPRKSAVRTSYLELANPPGPEVVTGKVTGRIVFDGEELPETPAHTIEEAQSKGCRDDGKPVDATNFSLVVSKDGGIKNCVVEIAVRGAELKIPEEPIELDQVQCLFDPHIVLIPAGATVEYLNSDEVSHNVHTYATRNPTINKTIAAGARDSQKLERPESIKVTCDIHPWMTSWIYVTDTPYATLSAADGSFTIENLPPGEYKLDVWHERLGKARADVTVKEDGSSAAVEVKLGEARSSGRRPRR